MLLGCQNSPFAEMDAVDGIRELSSWPIDAMELVADRPNSMPQEIDQTSRKEIRGIAEESHLALTVHSPFKGQDLTSPFPWKARKSITNAKGAIELASDLGAVGVVLHPGRGGIVPGPYLTGRLSLYDRLAGLVHSGTPPRPDNIKRNISALAGLLARARGAGVEIYLENLPRMRARKEFFNRALAAHRDLRLCYDYGHSLISDWHWLLEEHFDRVGYVHYHLNSGQADDHLPIDAKDEGARDFLGLLAGRGYRGIVMIEPNMGDLEGAKASVEATRSMIEGIARGE